MSARDIARRVLDRVEKGGAWATLALDAELARSGLDERDRRLASELVYGVLRNLARIDRALSAHTDLSKTPPKVQTALRVAAYQLLFLDRVPAYAAVDDAVKAASTVGQKLGGFANAVLRKLSASGEPPLPSAGDLGQTLARLEIEHSIPRWILDELTATTKGDPDRVKRITELATAFGEQPPLIGRVNTRKITREALIDELIGRAAFPGGRPTPPSGVVHRGAAVTSDDVPAPMNPGTPMVTAELPVLKRPIFAVPIAAVPSAIKLDGVGDPASEPAFLAGKWTVQDLGAQLVGHFADPKAGMKILDACAGVGGKSTHLAELTDDAATIDAADQSRTKLTLLGETAQRLGLTSIKTHVCDLTDPAAPLGTDYDLIVIDAPCSGLGVLRRHPDAKWRLTPDAVPRLAQLQEQLLEAVRKRLAPGGTLIYAVCTFTRAEGPDQIAKLVARTSLQLVDERRTWPPDADAFYIAKLQKPVSAG